MRIMGVLVILLFLTCASFAHILNRPDLDPWFDHLGSGRGACCSSSDGYVVEDADWETRDGHYRVRIPTQAGGSEMEWVDVPNDAVITEPNKAGKTMVWPLYGYLGTSIRCFMAGP